MGCRVIQYKRSLFIPELKASIQSWHQPHRDEISITNEGAFMKRVVFYQLEDVPYKYHAIKVEGKMWKCKVRDKYHLFWFGYHEDANLISINNKEIFFNE